jgi:N6-adenosine-specific RNA methylase IME4
VSDRTVKKQYDLIYADPPWSYRVWNHKERGRCADRHYQTSKLSSLAGMDLPSISKKNSVLLMWATFPCLFQALQLGRSWGFTYKTVAFVWLKRNRHNREFFVGLGHYTRANAELVLLFTRGSPLKRMSKAVQQIVVTERGLHSEKPPEIRKRIEKLFGEVSRVELFARSRSGLFPDEEYKGWDVYGNEVNYSIQINDKQELFTIKK